mgnify:CR=1 FL=1
MATAPAERPTLWFIGVSTGASSIMRVFPRWADHLGLDAAIAGMDFPPGADAQAYRDAVAFLKADPLSKGALVTTHKLDLFAACRDMFDEIGPHAALMEEVSCLSKPGGRLRAEAKDPVSAGLALDGLLGAGHFARTGGEMLVMGAGGSAIAMTWHLTDPARGADRPARIVVTDVDPARLAHIRAIHDRLGRATPVEYLQVEGASGNDAALAGLAPGSVVVNATGLGKDRPGSPLGEAARFPEGGVAWELNYRGDLVFLARARAQAQARGLTVADGWSYFVHGWTQVIGEVFGVEIPTSGPGFDAIAEIAAEATGRAA